DYYGIFLTKCNRIITSSQPDCNNTIRFLSYIKIIKTMKKNQKQLKPLNEMKMNLSKKIADFNLVAILLLTLTLASCSSSDDGPNNPEPPTTAAELAGSITETETLDASIEYTITGPVIVEEGGVLNIPAGTTLKAKQGFNNYILVLQGGKINIDGTADNPVVMTADSNNAQPGHWGGLIINGKAPLVG